MYIAGEEIVRGPVLRKRKKIINKFVSFFSLQVKLLRIDPESELFRDMVEFNVPYILLNITFPDSFPFQPPFLRVLAPKLEKVKE